MSEYEIQQQAAYWLIEQEDPEFSQEARARFEAWLLESPRHRDTYLAVERAWHRVTFVLKRAAKPSTVGSFGTKQHGWAARAPRVIRSGLRMLCRVMGARSRRH